jgi:hypothetical protein
MATYTNASLPSEHTQYRVYSATRAPPWGPRSGDVPAPAGAFLLPVFSHFRPHSGAFAFKYNVTPVPIVGMFETAIRAANASGDYDKARTCAVQKLEQVKILPYEAVEGDLQGGACNPSGFGYTIAAQSIGTDLGEGSGEEGLSMITVTVDWGGESSYSVSGVVSRW